MERTPILSWKSGGLALAQNFGSTDLQSVLVFDKLLMAFLKVLSLLLLLVPIAQASIHASPDVDKEPNLFGRRFVIVNLVPPPVQPVPQQQE